jgi:hypothetical protein
MVGGHHNACWSTIPMHVGRPPQCMVGGHHHPWWAADPTFSSFSFVCSSEIKTRNDDEMGFLRHPRFYRNNSTPPVFIVQTN